MVPTKGSYPEALLVGLGWEPSLAIAGGSTWNPVNTKWLLRAGPSARDLFPQSQLTHLGLHKAIGEAEILSRHRFSIDNS